MIVIVCGGRDLQDWPKARAALDYWHERLSITRVVQGGQTGGDALAKRWAELRSIPCSEEKVTPEEWKQIGPGAGPMRNRRMLDLHRPKRVIALPGGTGTANMLEQARGRRILCIEVV